MRARPKEVDFQVSYNVISPNPMTKMHGTFNNTSLSVGMQQKATEIAHIVLWVSWTPLTNKWKEASPACKWDLLLP